MSDPIDQHGTLRPGEVHPATVYAAQWLRQRTHEELAVWQEAFSSCAIEGNRLSEICACTLGRWMTGPPVSDRYLLGLVVAMQERKDP